MCLHFILFTFAVILFFTLRSVAWYTERRMKRRRRLLMNKTWPLIPVGWADNEIGPLSAACQKFFTGSFYKRSYNVEDREFSLAFIREDTFPTSLSCLFISIWRPSTHRMHFCPANKNEILTVDWLGVFFHTDCRSITLQGTRRLYVLDWVCFSGRLCGTDVATVSHNSSHLPVSERLRDAALGLPVVAALSSQMRCKHL